MRAAWRKSGTSARPVRAGGRIRPPASSARGGGQAGRQQPRRTRRLHQPLPSGRGAAGRLVSCHAWGERSTRRRGHLNGYKSSHKTPYSVIFLLVKAVPTVWCCHGTGGSLPKSTRLSSGRLSEPSFLSKICFDSRSIGGMGVHPAVVASLPALTPPPAAILAGRGETAQGTNGRLPILDRCAKLWFMGFEDCLDWGVGYAMKGVRIRNRFLRARLDGVTFVCVLP